MICTGAVRFEKPGDPALGAAPSLFAGAVTRTCHLLTIPGLDPDKGVSLADAIALYGDLPNPRRYYSYRRTLLAGVCPGEEVIGRYVDDDIAGRARVIEKLKNGELRATGLPRGAPLNEPPVEIHSAHWRVLKPDFVTSAATSPAVTLDGILIYANPPPNDGYGDKRMRWHATSFAGPRWLNAPACQTRHCGDWSGLAISRTGFS
jgi:hypothetical protein